MNPAHTFPAAATAPREDLRQLQARWDREVNSYVVKLDDNHQLEAKLAARVAMARWLAIIPVTALAVLLPIVIAIAIARALL